MLDSQWRIWADVVSSTSDQVLYSLWIKIMTPDKPRAHLPHGNSAVSDMEDCKLIRKKSFWFRINGKVMEPLWRWHCSQNCKYGFNRWFQHRVSSKNLTKCYYESAKLRKSKNVSYSCRMGMPDFLRLCPSFWKMSHLLDSFKLLTCPVAKADCSGALAVTVQLAVK